MALGAPQAQAHLAHGVVAPEFALQAAKGGEVETVDLKAALASGPVVLYFFPKSFTSGCTVEAHLFSEHVADFTQARRDGDRRQRRRHRDAEEVFDPRVPLGVPGRLRSRAEDRQAVRRGAGAGLRQPHGYVIAHDGTIAYAYTNLDPSKHVENTLGALRELDAKPK